MKKILIILTCLLFLVGCSNNQDDNKEKISSEIEYFSTQIADLFNNLNNISLENYELISEKVSMSSSSSSSGGGEDSQSGSSQNSSQSSGQSSTNQGERRTNSINN